MASVSQLSAGRGPAFWPPPSNPLLCGTPACISEARLLVPQVKPSWQRVMSEDQDRYCRRSWCCFSATVEPLPVVDRASLISFGDMSRWRTF